MLGARKGAVCGGHRTHLDVEGLEKRRDSVLIWRKELGWTVTVRELED